MAQDPKPRSYQQRLGDLQNGLSSRTGITGLRVGGSLLSMLEANATSGTRDTQDVFAALNANDPGRLVGDQLDRYGLSRGVRRRPAVAATTQVSISDTSFAKVSSPLSPLVSPPLPGQTTLRIQDASLFTSSGAVYVGRGTSSLEGPITYSSKVNNGSDWTLNLTGTISRRHDGSEQVVLAQGGNRTVSAGTIIQTPQGNALTSASYSVVTNPTIPDGEVLVEGVDAVCTQPGESGNVPAGSISSFTAPPFPGAAVTNLLPVTTGQNVQKDPQYFDDIRKTTAAQALGTPNALERFSIGITAPDEPRTVLSASYVDRVGQEPAVLTIDDGTGYQPIDTGVAQEQLVGAAVGGELDFQVSGGPVTKAALNTTTSPPWALQPGDALAFEVGGVSTEHQLNPNSYSSGADPYAVADDCNSNPRLLWEARVADSGQQLIFRAKSEYADDIRSIAPTIGRDAATAVLGVGTLLEQTLFLYLNDQLLHKDGHPASYPSRPFGQWAAVSGSQTLSVNVDNTGATTYTITDADFAGTGYSSVGRNSPQAWVIALRRRIPGATPTVALDRLLLSSNSGAVAGASIAITGGSLVAAGFFSVGSALGASADFSLNRGTAQGRLTTPLLPGDRLEVGSIQTRGYLPANVTTPVTFTTTPTWWIALDSAAVNIAFGVTAGTSLTGSIGTNGLRPWGDRLRLLAMAGTFSVVQAGDYAVLWDALTPTSLYGCWSIAQIAPDGSWIELDRRQGTYARYRAASVVLASGKVLCCGGYALPGNATPLRSAEVYDPATQLWTAVGLMATARGEHWAVLMPSGKVLVGGGETSTGVSTPEIFDPATGLFTPASTTGAPVSAVGQKAVVSGTIAYVVGGYNAGLNVYLNTTYEYDTVADTWTAGGVLAAARARHTLNLFAGKLWATGGEDAASTLDSVEQYDTGAHTWAAGGTLTSPRQSHRASTFATELLVTGGSSARDVLAAVRLADTVSLPLAGPPWVVGPNMATARAYHGQITLSGGKGLVAGGEAAAAPAEVYDPAGPSFSVTGQPLLSPLVSLELQALAANTALLGFGSFSNEATASSERWALIGGVWTASDPIVGTSFSLTSAGINITRSADRLRRIRLGTATTQTATAIQGSLDTALDQGGAGMYVDRSTTNKLRWRTNSWESSLDPQAAFVPSGDIMVAGQDLSAKQVGWITGNREDSQGGQVAWLVSGNPQVGTPSFEAASVLGAGTSVLSWWWSSQGSATSRPSASDWVVGLGGRADSYSQTRFGQAAGHHSQWSLRQAAPGASSYYYLRTSPEQGWTPTDRAYAASPWSIGPRDRLTIVVDNDPGHRRYDVQMYRRLKTISTTYSISGDYADADLSPAASLGTSFGINYDFTDHAVFMRARGKTHAADPSRSILWRWWLHGPGGEFATVAYGAPLAPSSNVTVSVDDTIDSQTRVLVRLAGGALKTGAQIRSSTYLGVAAPSSSLEIADLVIAAGLAISSAVRAANVTTLTLALPTGITDHGIPSGVVIHVASTDVNFSSGIKALTAVTATTVSYVETAANAGPDANPGFLSRDLAEDRLDTYSPALVNGDWVRLSALTSTLPSAFLNQTFRLTGSGRQVLYARATSFTVGPSTVLSWGQIIDPTYLRVFVNPTQTATAIAAAVQASYAAGTSPVQPTVLGTGAGTIGVTSDDEAIVHGTWFGLYDGRNAIASQVAPGIPANNYTFTFKDAVEPSIATGSDWANEDVRLAPVTAAATARWLQAAAVSGLFPGAHAEPAGRGEHLQLWSSKLGSSGAIQVTGGSANSWSATLRGPSYSADSGAAMVSAISTASIFGFVDGAWARIQLSIPAERPVFSSTTSLSVLTSAGQLTVINTSPKLWDGAGSTPHQTNRSLAVELQGRFVRYQDQGLGAALDLTGVNEGDWVMITTPAAPTVGAPSIAATNRGLHRIVRATTAGGVAGLGCFWVEVTTHTPCTICEADIRFFADGSVLPGDILTIGAPTWGAANEHSWVVSDLGDNGGGSYTDQWTINLDTTAKAPTLTNGPLPLGSSYSLFRVVPPTSQRWFKRVRSSTPEAGGLTRVRMEGGSGWGVVNEAHGAVMTALDKLEFSQAMAQGRDGYHYNVGLVGAVSRVLVGDPEDPVTYPGVETAGSLVRIDGPRVRRVFFSIQVRLRDGYSSSDVIVAVQSAIAAAVLARPHGKPIPISDLIDQASLVVGVDGVAPISPYSPVVDQIPVQPGERALVLNPSTDVSVTVVGG